VKIPLSNGTLEYFAPKTAVAVFLEHHPSSGSDKAVDILDEISRRGAAQFETAASP